MRRYTHPFEPERDCDVTWLYYRCWWQGLRQRRLFDQVQAYCMFIGYPRSGHSLIGSLLDAHPDVVIAHELDAMGYLAAGFSRDQIYALIMQRDQAFTAAGRRWGDYEYRVPDQWQGRVRQLRVIGDKKGGLSTLWLQKQPEMLDRMRQAVGVPLRLIHVVRNPFDNITTILRRGQRPDLASSAEWYIGMCRTIAELVQRTQDGSILTIRHEQMVAEPAATLRKLCEFVGVSCTDDYLSACASIVFRSPKRTRHEVPWPPELIARVQDEIERIEFLRGYSYDAASAQAP